MQSRIVGGANFYFKVRPARMPVLAYRYIALPVHRRVAELLFHKIPRIGNVHGAHFSIRPDRGIDDWINPRPVCRQVELLIARDHLIAQRRIEMHAVLVD